MLPLALPCLNDRVIRHLSLLSLSKKKGFGSQGPPYLSLSLSLSLPLPPLSVGGFDYTIPELILVAPKMVLCLLAVDHDSVIIIIKPS